MPPQGAGPTRKSHTKSRKGCRTCKRRHIRCDENFPQCKNCTKHNCRCDYMDSPPTEEAPRSPQQPNLLLNPKIEQEIEKWQHTGVFPLPEPHLRSLQHVRGFSSIDLRLIHHLSNIYQDMRLADFVPCTLWVQQIPRFFDVAVEHDFVMSSILAFSATHLAWMTSSVETKNLAYFHRDLALKGLQEAIGNFSERNSDAALAASILLSWQASDWDMWTPLMAGISTVIGMMGTWKGNSLFFDFIEENPSFFSPQILPTASVSFEDDSLFQATNALRRLSARLPNVHPLAQRLRDAIDFAHDFQSCSTAMQSKQLFEKLQPFRAWLFWMPVTLVTENDMGNFAMILLAQLYTLSLAIDSSIPELKGAALGSLAVHAIEQIDNKLRYRQSLSTGIEISPSELDELMQFCRMTAARAQLALQSGPAQVKLEDIDSSFGAQPMPQQSPYNFRPLSIGSQPGTPTYPPPGTPGLSSTPPMLPTHSFEDLSHPPSPFLNYQSPISPRQSQYLEASSRAHSLSFETPPLAGYEYNLRGESPGYSPAYSPAAYSPGFMPDPEEEAWQFRGNSPGYTAGDHPYDESSHGGRQPRMN